MNEILNCIPFLLKEPKPIWGCVRDLEQKSKEHCLNQPDDCKTCTGNDCNSMTQFQRCNLNNTNNDAILSTWKHKIRSKICTKFDDKCFTLVSEDNSIVKDCLNDYAVRHNVSIDFLEKYNKSLYDVCTTRLCNNQTIRSMYCFECDSSTDENCDSTPLESAVDCPLEINFSGCFHRFDGQNTQRGCIINLDEELRPTCESDSNECKKCIDNECNSRLYFQRCITDNMKVDNAPKESKLCKRYSDECFIHLKNDIVRRGCKSDIIEAPDIGIDLKTDCKNSTICELCSKRNNCNDRKVTNELCIACESDTEDFCASAPEMLDPKECPLALKKQGCYLIQETAERVQRGCLAHMNAIDRSKCISGNGTCKICVGDKCNQKTTFQTCYACTSVADGDKCLSSPQLSHKITCSRYLGHCYTMVTNGLTARGCTGDMTVPTIETCNRNPENCKHCSGNEPCNDKTVNAITCVHCDSSFDATCATNQTFDAIKSCSVSNLQPQQCYHFINQTSKQHMRGNGAKSV